MPGAITTTTTTGAERDYLRALPPAWATLQTGLCIFAAAVILRFCIRRIYHLIRPGSSGHHPPPYTATQSSAWPEYLYPQPSGQDPYQAHADYLQPHWAMDEKEGRPGIPGAGDGMRSHHVSFRDSDAPVAPGAPRRWESVSDGALRHLISRPPPAPPLTPPELSSTVFTLEDRPTSRDSFIHQPNPDYTSPSTASSESQPSTIGPTSRPRRLSYNKTVPVGVPVSRQSSASESDLVFSPSSYPPASPLLPPAPPTSPPERPADQDSSAQREIDMRGEIVSVLDDKGVGWSRHTRVYGGGACLACAAAGRHHGEGGFYGPNVMPEEMR